MVQQDLEKDGSKFVEANRLALLQKAIKACELTQKPEWMEMTAGDADILRCLLAFPSYTEIRNKGNEAAHPIHDRALSRAAVLSQPLMSLEHSRLAGMFHVMYEEPL